MDETPFIDEQERVILFFSAYPAIPFLFVFISCIKKKVQEGGQGSAEHTNKQAQASTSKSELGWTKKKNECFDFFGCGQIGKQTQPMAGNGSAT